MITQRLDHQVALLAATERKRQLAEIERDEKISKLRDQMDWTVRPHAEKEWRKAQVEFPDDHDLAVQAARKEVRREVNYWMHSRVWPEVIDSEIKRIIAETFKPAPTVEVSERTDHAALPIRNTPIPNWVSFFLVAAFVLLSVLIAREIRKNRPSVLNNTGKQ